MTSKPRPPACTCDDTGACGFCPSIGITAAAESRPYTDPAWAGTLGHRTRRTRQIQQAA